MPALTVLSRLSELVYLPDGGLVAGAEEGGDYLDGGAGKDTYVFYRGDGADLLIDDSTGAEASVPMPGRGIMEDNTCFRSASAGYGRCPVRAGDAISGRVG